MKLRIAGCGLWIAAVAAIVVGAALALYDDNPNRINTILSDLDKMTALDVQQAAKKYLVPANRTIIDRRPGGGQ